MEVELILTDFSNLYQISISPLTDCFLLYFAKFLEAALLDKTFVDHSILFSVTHAGVKL